MNKLSLLILSYSNIRSDARVLRQVRLFQDIYAVTTCGYGSSPSDSVEHIEIPSNLVYWQRDRLATVLHMYRRAYWSSPVSSWCRQELSGRKFDMILADDLDSQGLAAYLQPRYGFHADLHEYSPSQHEELSRWRWFVSPYVRWQLRKYVSQAVSSTTVAPTIAKRYNQEFGLNTKVVFNASPYHDLQPSSLGNPIRLVHAGASNPNRDLEMLIAAVAPLEGRYTLDFYLTDSTPGYVDKLRGLAAAHQHIQLHPALPYEQLIPTLNQYDLALYSFPPNTYNLLYCLPNKFFDSVQARLGVVTGPNPEIAAMVEKYDLGVVSADFSADSLSSVLKKISSDEVKRWKENSHAHACELSAQKQSFPWVEAMNMLATRHC